MKNIVIYLHIIIHNRNYRARANCANSPLSRVRQKLDKSPYITAGKNCKNVRRHDIERKKVPHNTPREPRALTEKGKKLKKHFIYPHNMGRYGTYLAIGIAGEEKREDATHYGS